MIYLFREAAAEPCASLNLCAQSSQQTSTVFPPILTLKQFPSSLQSQAAQVVSTMTLLSPARSPGKRAVAHERRECHCQNLWRFAGRDLATNSRLAKFRRRTAICFATDGTEMDVTGAPEVE